MSMHLGKLNMSSHITSIIKFLLMLSISNESKKKEKDHPRDIGQSLCRSTRHAKLNCFSAILLAADDAATNANKQQWA